jgi:hypothetical protein
VRGGHLAYLAYFTGLLAIPPWEKAESNCKRHPMQI